MKIGLLVLENGKTRAAAAAKIDPKQVALQGTISSSNPDFFGVFSSRISSGSFGWRGQNMEKQRKTGS